MPLDAQSTAASLTLAPIGFFHCAEKHPYDAARQGALSANEGCVSLLAGHHFAEALRDLDGFSHIWLLYWFHHNQNWRPLIQPPRGLRKVGVFACRAPYRPNPIGLSCVELLAVTGNRVTVRGHDLLDGTPILDIKPYLPYADSHPNARTGWLEQADLDDPPWEIRFEPLATAQLAWLVEQGVTCLEPFLRQQLTHEPLNHKRKRVQASANGVAEIAYRTWRARFTTDAAAHAVLVHVLFSGYSGDELNTADDPHDDKPLHRAFNSRWLSAASGKEIR